MSRPGGKQLYAIAQRGVDIIIELNDTLVDLMATDDDVEYELIENVKQKVFPQLPSQHHNQQPSTSSVSPARTCPTGSPAFKTTRTA